MYFFYFTTHSPNGDTFWVEQGTVYGAENETS